MNTIFFSIIFQLSRLPLSVLYIFSDFLNFLLNTVISYRKEVIMNNLRNSFPEKSEKEINQIRKEFYRNFADYLVETLKAFTMSQEQFNRRHTYTNNEIFQIIKNEKRDTLMMAGHVFNWEWFLGLMTPITYENTAVVYHKIKNPFWNEKMLQMRGRAKTFNLDMKDVLRFMMKAPNDGTFAYLFIADQSPKREAIHHWIKFLNQETAVFNGFDKIARRKDMGVVYCNIVKVKRGYYHTTFERIEPEDGIQFKENEVVDQFFHKLENTIKANPSNWLWSHKRWKFKKEN